MRFISIYFYESDVENPVYILNNYYYNIKKNYGEFLIFMSLFFIHYMKMYLRTIDRKQFWFFCAFYLVYTPKKM